MTLVIILVCVVLGLQIGIFFYTKMMKKKMKENDVLIKYDINNRSDLFQALSNQNIPENDISELQRIYQEKEGE